MSVRFLRGVVVTAIGIVLIAYLLGYFENTAPIGEQRATGGVLDLRAADFERSIYVLSGDWQFVPGRAVAPTEFFNVAKHQIAVPANWSKLRSDDLNIAALSSNTYGLIVLLPNNHPEIMGLRFDIIRSDCRLFVNDKEVYSVGCKDGSNSSMFNVSRPETVFFPVQGERTKIVIQCTNDFFPKSGGIISAIYFGSQQQILRKQSRATAADSSVAAYFILALLMFFGMFLQRSGKRELLYLTMFCVFVCVFFLTINQKILVGMVPAVSMTVLIKLQCFSANLALLMIMQYYGVSLPDKALQLSRKVAAGIGYLLAALALVVPVQLFLTHIIVMLVWQLCIILLVAELIIRALINKAASAWVLFFGMACSLAMYIAVVVDIFLGYDTLPVVAIAVPLFLSTQLLFITERDKKEQLAVRLAAGELAYLRAQIKPHFIYNALASIAALIRREPAVARETLLDFSDFLRQLLKSGDSNSLSTLGEEVKIAENYLRIEKIRFGEKLQVQFSIPDELNNVRLPVLTLQPLIENAIKHTLAATRSEAVVRIVAEASDGRVNIAVTDDGPGIEADKLRAIEQGKTSGIGLRNVRERLRRCGGNMLVKSSNSGTSISVDIPRKIDTE